MALTTYLRATLDSSSKGSCHGRGCAWVLNSLNAKLGDEAMMQLTQAQASAHISVHRAHKNKFFKHATKRTKHSDTCSSNMRLSIVHRHMKSLQANNIFDNGYPILQTNTCGKHRRRYSVCSRSKLLCLPKTRASFPAARKHPRLKVFALHNVQRRPQAAKIKYKSTAEQRDLVIPMIHAFLIIRPSLNQQ